MALYNGYKYNQEQDAKDAISACDVYHGIPANESDTTTHWTNYLYAGLNVPVFWYIMYDVSLVPILGEPTEFEVNLPEIV